MVKRVVIVGGGTAGWMAAALLARVMGRRVSVDLVESEKIGAIGVGEATIPPIQSVNAVLGIAQGDFLRETKATIKLGIRFANWGAVGDDYYHAFGATGRDTAFCGFHHFWTRARHLGMDVDYWDCNLNYLAAQAGRFAPGPPRQDPMWDIPHAYHFDAGLYAACLRRLSEAMGVRRSEGVVRHVQRDALTGDVTALALEDGREIAGDLFLDCSGARGVLIQQALNTGYEDWSHWLPCDRAVAVPSERFEASALYTKAIAHGAGWQWRIPLQHRNGNGLVYSSRHLGDDQAADLLLAHLDGKALDSPRVIPFRTGRTRQQWHRNVVAIGLSSGFLEPLESTSIHLIQSAIVRLLGLFPHGGSIDRLRDAYNCQTARDYELIRDFIILHYHANRREEPFWRDLARMAVPDRLSATIALFRESGGLAPDPQDIFTESSWVQVMLGQGIVPLAHHPLAGALGEADLRRQFEQMEVIKRRPLADLPLHDDYLHAAMSGSAADV